MNATNVGEKKNLSDFATYNACLLNYLCQRHIVTGRTIKWSFPTCTFIGVCIFCESFACFCHILNKAALSLFVRRCRGQMSLLPKQWLVWFKYTVERVKNLDRSFPPCYSKYFVRLDVQSTNWTASNWHCVQCTLARSDFSFPRSRFYNTQSVRRWLDMSLQFKSNGSVYLQDTFEDYFWWYIQKNHCTVLEMWLSWVLLRILIIACAKNKSRILYVQHEN